MFERTVQQRSPSLPIAVTRAGIIQRKCACGQHSHGQEECSACRSKRVAGLYRKALGNSPEHVPAIVTDVLRSPGVGLEPSVKTAMEKHFHADLSQVRVHTDRRAAQAAESVNAHAFTVGQHVVFGADQFQPRTRAGRKLLAHELTHTLQQRASSGLAVGRLEVAPEHTAAESEANRVAEAFDSYRNLPRISAQPVQLAREERNVCGPDVTKQTKDACALTRTTFALWNNDEKKERCETLFSSWTGPTAWDVDELHNHEWIKRYNPECAVGGQSKSCVASVEVNEKCFYAGSVNYVIFGVMCRLCFDHFVSIGQTDSDYTENSMLSSITMYKGGGTPWGWSTAGNFHTSQKWSKTGYRGWPNGGTPDADRGNCTKCSLKYEEGWEPGRLPIDKKGHFKMQATGAFSIHWAKGVGHTFWLNQIKDASDGWFGGSGFKPNPSNYGF